MTSEFIKRFIYFVIFVEFINSIFNNPFLYHINTIILIILGYSVKIKLKNWEILALIFSLLFSLQSLIKEDITSFLKSTSYLIFIISFRRLALFARIDYNKLIIYFLTGIVLPTFLLFCLIKIPIKIPEYTTNIDFTIYNRLLPNESNGYRVTIGPPNYTKHFTGTIGLMGLFSSLLLYTKHKKRLYLYLGVFCLYLLVFSGSRTAVTVLICCILLFYTNFHKIKLWPSFIILSIFIIQFYTIDLAIQTITPYLEKNIYISEYSGIENSSNEIGITSGRYFLWDYHLSLFLKNPLLGINANLIRFKIGDLLPNGVVAIAASESYYTAMLAEFGVLGLFFPILHLYFFYTALTRGNSMLVIWVCIFILSNVYSSEFENIYTSLCRIIFMIILPTGTSPYRVRKKISLAYSNSFNIQNKIDTI